LRTVPVEEFGPVLRRLLTSYDAESQEVVADRAGISVDTITRILSGERESCEFDVADSLLCALNATQLWYGELGHIYYTLDLAWEKCACPGCEAIFTLEYDTLGRMKQRLYCSTACRTAAHKIRHGVHKQRLPKSRRNMEKFCRNGHPKTPENIIEFSNGTSTCRICKQASAEKYRRAKGSQAIETHCKRGHLRTPENTQWFANGRRTCRTCALESARNWRKENREHVNRKQRENLARRNERKVAA
jgi:hypothetical protein